MNKWILAGSLVLMLALLGLAGCAEGTTLSSAPENFRVNLNSQQEGVWAGGTGKVTVVPDIATLSLGIEAQGASVAEAQSQANKAMNDVMDALTSNGVAKNDIKTQQFSIQRVTKWDKDKEQEVVIGYRVTNMVIAKIRDIGKAGIIIDAVARAGGDLTRVDSVGFSVDDPSTYYAQAREKAMTDARAKAEQLAKLGGVTLGKPTYISENVYMPGPVYLRAALEAASVPAAAPPPISPGEMEITLNVQVTYAIIQ